MMMRIVAAVSCIAVVCNAMTTAGPGPAGSLDGSTCSAEGKYTADKGNMCWFHECVLNSGQALVWMPRRCAWMSRVSSFYTEGEHNPCTIRILDNERMSGNPCARTETATDGPPTCHPKTCQNGGTPVYEANLCWCECPPTWQGDHDCSRPTMMPGSGESGSNICVDGAPGDDWCTMAGGCLNGGTCHNQCDTFWCDCGEMSAMSNDHVGKRCEIYQTTTLD